jgi:hypothetical protein
VEVPFPAAWRCALVLRFPSVVLVVAAVGAPDSVVFGLFWPVGCCRRKRWWLLCDGDTSVAHEVFVQWVCRPGVAVGFPLMSSSVGARS